MSSPRKIHSARLKSVKHYLVNKRTSIWKFGPTASEARDNELTATSDSDWRGCVKTRKSTTGIVLRYAGNKMVSALSEAKHVQEILGQYHEDTTSFSKQTHQQPRQMYSALDVEV